MGSETPNVGVGVAKLGPVGKKYIGVGCSSQGADKGRSKWMVKEWACKNREEDKDKG